MKKIIISMIAGACLTFSSCKDYLNVSDELASSLTIEQTFENVRYTKRWHANIFNCISEYSRIFDGVTGFSNPWFVLSGEGATNWDNLRTEMTNGFNASNAHFHRFNSIYQSIRQANLFLKKAKPIGVSTDKEKLTAEEINRMKSEAKFFIAYAYFSLFELYGPVPIVTDAVESSSTSFDFPRVSVDEMVNFIDGMYQEVLNENFLPQTLRTTDVTGSQVENMNEMVRPTRAVVLALRAKLWVYAASKLFNGGYSESLTLKNKDGKQLFSPYNASKWETAKRHLETFLNFAETNGYTLFRKSNGDGTENYSQSVYRLFQDWNKEIIWASSNTYMNEVDGSFDRRCRPTAILDGFSGISVSQRSVDAFFTKNGLDINEDPEHNETGFTDIENPSAYVKPQVDKHIFNMYVNREPRFYNAITYQGRSWHIQPSNNWFVDFSVNGNNSNNIAYREHYTGYLLYKRTNQEMYPGGSYLRNYARPSILLRLADFYLYYAEVCNEISPSDPNIIKYLDLVRERAGIPGYKKLQETGKKTGVIGDYEDQAYAIRRERQVELFSEGQRYFDIRRWMICGPGEEADQTKYWGMNVDGKSELPPSDPNSFYRRKLIRNHQWMRAMYLYPIPHDEIVKSPSLVQNPLW
ncbi:RagB/SusD family nutrient uptake outer membrane protein [Pedobacter nyackensis]|uniref:RagB/SusD family nutrient uptake outer membrane protein n=1 Tax=Pedobacter nyackensis TaxID=475255 RepID=UPI00292E1E91|nr:RagB/SusD family nutrient uptake outer membrane protein [Pedobacter nyackensis]